MPEAPTQTKSSIQYWIVWSPSGSTPPKKKHPTYESAFKEAERLASHHAGQDFVVLLAQTEVRRSVVHYTTITALA